jgi:hypothetical protein
VDATERRLVYIVVGMLVAFIGIFLLMTNLPPESLRWLWGQ